MFCIVGLVIRELARKKSAVDVKYRQVGVS